MLAGASVGLLSAEFDELPESFILYIIFLNETPTESVNWGVCISFTRNINFSQE